MHVPKIQLSKFSQNAADKIVKHSVNKKISLGEQMICASYYGYLHSKAESHIKDFPKILLTR